MISHIKSGGWKAGKKINRKNNHLIKIDNLNINNLKTELQNLSSPKQTEQLYYSRFGQPGAITINTVVHAKAPIQDKAYSLKVNIKWKDPEKGIISFEDEKQVLENIEKVLISNITSSNNSIYVGNFIHDPIKVFYFYIGSEKCFEDLVDNLQAAFPKYIFDYSYSHDKNWDVYLNFLYKVYSGVKIQNTIKDFASKGLSIEPEVSHWIFFNVEKDKKKFLRKIKNDGFKVVFQSCEHDEIILYSLCISRPDKIDWESLDNNSNYLTTIAMECNGDYDGYEIEKPAPGIKDEVSDGIN